MSVKDLYTGKGGQLAAMAEFVMRGYNVAVPEIDRGDDIFVVRDQDGDLSRIQVKTAVARALKKNGCFTAKFSIPIEQLKLPQLNLYFVMAIRLQGHWGDFIVIPRANLNDVYASNQSGLRKTKQSKDWTLNLSFSPTDVLSNQQSFQAFRNRWDYWPIILHA